MLAVSISSTVDEAFCDGLLCLNGSDCGPLVLQSRLRSPLCIDNDIVQEE
jgi:hypothetical protein